MSMFAVMTLQNSYTIADRVGVLFPFAIFALVVLEDSMLLSLLDILPVGFEPNIVDRVASVYQLHCCGTISGVNCRVHSEAHRAKYASPTLV